MLGTLVARLNTACNEILAQPEIRKKMDELAISVSPGTPSAFAAKAATGTTPIVFSAAGDPVEIGLVPALNHPGGNITGMAVFNATLGAKRVLIRANTDGPGPTGRRTRQFAGLAAAAALPLAWLLRVPA